MDENGKAKGCCLPGWSAGMALTWWRDFGQVGRAIKGNRIMMAYIRNSIVTLCAWVAAGVVCAWLFDGQEDLNYFQSVLFVVIGVCIVVGVLCIWGEKPNTRQ